MGAVSCSLVPCSTGTRVGPSAVLLTGSIGSGRRRRGRMRRGTARRGPCRPDAYGHRLPQAAGRAPRPEGEGADACGGRARFTPVVRRAFAGGRFKALRLEVAPRCHIDGGLRESPNHRAPSHRDRPSATRHRRTRSPGGSPRRSTTNRFSSAVVFILAPPGGRPLSHVISMGVVCPHQEFNVNSRCRNDNSFYGTQKGCGTPRDSAGLRRTPRDTFVPYGMFGTY
jgi:hypothetical protein